MVKLKTWWCTDPKKSSAGFGTGLNIMGCIGLKVERFPFSGPITFVTQKNMMEPIRLTLDPGGTTYPDNPHDGEEFGYILSGSISIYLGTHTVHRTHYIFKQQQFL